MRDPTSHVLTCNYSENLRLDQCNDDAACQSGNNPNKVCSSGSCVCKTGYYSDSTGTCLQGMNIIIMLTFYLESECSKFLHSDYSVYMKIIYQIMDKGMAAYSLIFGRDRKNPTRP